MTTSCLPEQVMVHESQLDEGKLRSVKAKRPSDYYHRGMKVRLEIFDRHQALLISSPLAATGMAHSDSFRSDHLAGLAVCMS